MQIHIVTADKGCAVPDFVSNVAYQRNGKREVQAEEIDGQFRVGHLGLLDGGHSDPELTDENQDVEDETNPGADDARLAAEGELGECMALELPAFPEADVGEAN